MLQVDICPFASDALEDAMRLAQTKALNSYTFSDCINFLNYVWADIYSQICMIDSGYYSRTVQLKSKLTKLPKFVRNSVRVYSAQRPDDIGSRYDFRVSDDGDNGAGGTYRISGTDLFCPSAERTTVWLEYCPQPPQLFFTHHNRDPKIYPDGHDVIRSADYQLYTLINDKGINIADRTVSGDDIVLMDGIRTDTDHRSCRQGEQGQVVSGKVHTTVNERLARHGVLLLPEAETHQYLFLFRCLKGHHESAGGLQ